MLRTWLAGVRRHTWSSCCRRGTCGAGRGEAGEAGRQQEACRRGGVGIQGHLQLPGSCPVPQYHERHAHHATACAQCTLGGIATSLEGSNAACGWGTNFYNPATDFHVGLLPHPAPCNSTCSGSSSSSNWRGGGSSRRRAVTPVSFSPPAPPLSIHSTPGRQHASPHRRRRSPHPSCSHLPSNTPTRKAAIASTPLVAGQQSSA
jgi:hypothetical protein